MTQDFFPGFSWAVPTAFATPLGQCRFEQGDTLYDTPKAYDGKWRDALNYVHYAIHVISPARAVGRAGEGDKTLFEDNWSSPVEFTLTDYKLRTSRPIKTTQGRLYTLLWKNDFGALEEQQPPPVPLSLRTTARLAETVAPIIKQRLTAGMEKPNVFVMPCDPTNAVLQLKYVQVQAGLRAEFKVEEGIFWPAELGIAGDLLLPPTIHFVGLAIDLGASAKVSDALKRILYRPSKDKKTDKDSFRLSAHGVFLQHTIKGHGDIQTVSFDHAERFYRYRIHVPRLDRIPRDLSDFLRSLIVDCPNDCFNEPPYCSKLKLELPIKVTRDRLHKLTDLAGASFEARKYQDNHENVQVYLLEHDPATVAMETPVWATWEDLGPYAKHVYHRGVLTRIFHSIPRNSP